MRLILFEKFFKIHLIVRQKALIGCLVKMLKGEGVETFCILHAADVEPKPRRTEPNKLFMELKLFLFWVKPRIIMNMWIVYNYSNTSVKLLQSVPSPSILLSSFDSKVLTVVSVHFATRRTLYVFLSLKYIAHHTPGESIKPPPKYSNIIYFIWNPMNTYDSESVEQITKSHAQHPKVQRT